jgi:hypothetical protein
MVLDELRDSAAVLTVFSFLDHSREVVSREKAG